MKLVTFMDARTSRRRIGALLGDRVVAIEEAHAARTGAATLDFTSMRALIASGKDGLDRAREAVAFGNRAGDPDFVVALTDLRLQAPLPDPVMLRCCSLFRGHHVNCRCTIAAWATGRRPSPDEIKLPDIVERMPGWYKGNHLNIIGPDDEIAPPAYAGRLDFELELALVVGTGGIDIDAERFGDHVFGWSIFNDVSARDPQLEEMQLGVGPFKGKDFDTSNVMGPCIVTSDEFDPTKALAIARVNGEEWGRGDATDMIHAWPDVLAFRSRGERLHAGEVITSGAFTNCSGIEQDRYLSPGDVVELEIVGIGVLRNPVADRVS